MLLKVHFWGKYESFNQGPTIRLHDTFETLSTLLSLLFNSKFSSTHQLHVKNDIELLSTFFDESHRKPNAKSENKTDKHPLLLISAVYFLSLLVAEKLSQTSTIPLGIFLGWTLWADSISLQMNTIGSCDQFKSVRIRENLLVN